MNEMLDKHNNEGALMIWHIVGIQIDLIRSNARQFNNAIELYVVKDYPLHRKASRS